LTADTTVFDAEPAKPELAAAEAIGAHCTAGLDTALWVRLHRCGGGETLMAVALTVEAAIPWAGPAVAIHAAATTVATHGAAGLPAALWPAARRLGLRSRRGVGKAPSEQGPSQLGLLLQSCISVNFQPS